MICLQMFPSASKEDRPLANAGQNESRAASRQGRRTTHDPCLGASPRSGHTPAHGTALQWGDRKTSRFSKILQDVPRFEGKCILQGQMSRRWQKAKLVTLLGLPEGPTEP